MFDTAIFDAEGVAVSHKLYDKAALGGSEFQQLLLAEALADNGYNVLYLSKNPTTYLQKYTFGSIKYAPLDYKFETENLILVRNSPYDWKQNNYKKAFVYAHDTNYGGIYSQAHSEMFQNTNARLVCVSNWQAQLFKELNWPTTVVYNSIPDSVFNTPVVQKKKQFIYASAMWKGLQQTIDFFNQIKQNPRYKGYKLKVLSPGYENFDGNFLTNQDIEWVGAVKFNDVIKHIAESESLLYYNTMAETFGIVPALAAILSTTPIIYQADKTWHSGGALPEIVGPQFVVDNFSDFVKMMFTHKPTGQSDYKYLSQSYIFENHWKPLLGLE